MIAMLPKDLDIDAIFDTGDSVVAPEYTFAMITTVGYVRVVGISDHLEYPADGMFERYAREVRQAGLRRDGTVHLVLRHPDRDFSRCRGLACQSIGHPHPNLS